MSVPIRHMTVFTVLVLVLASAFVCIEATCESGAGAGWSRMGRVDTIKRLANSLSVALRAVWPERPSVLAVLAIPVGAPVLGSESSAAALSLRI